MEICTFLYFNSSALQTMNLSVYVKSLSDDVIKRCMEELYVYSSDAPIDAIVDEKFVTLRPILRVFLPTTCALGLFGNLASIAVFLTKSMRGKSCVTYLMMKCGTDTLFLVALFIVWLERMKVPWFHAPIICHTVVFFTYLCSFMSAWLVVMVTFENYIRICHPGRVQTFCTLRAARIVLSAMGAVGAVCYNVSIWTTHSQLTNQTYTCRDIPEYHDYAKILTYTDTALTLILPFSLNVTWMCAIFRGLLVAKRRGRRLQKSSSRSRTKSTCGGRTTPYSQVTWMLLAVTVTFTLLHTPAHVIRLHLIVDRFVGEDLNRYIDHIRLQRYLELLYYTNFSTNFFIYVVSGKCFRDIWRNCLAPRACLRRPAAKVEQLKADDNCFPMGERLQTTEYHAMINTSFETQNISQV